MFTIANKHIPSHDLKILNWDFDTVTGSDASGDFEVDDITSGSTDTIYGWPDTIIRREHKGRGRDFGASKTAFVDSRFVFALKKELQKYLIQMKMYLSRAIERLTLSKMMMSPIIFPFREKYETQLCVREDA